ncbi:Zinc finger protein 750 [Frankliniella fusca]|uniref:Zinc finger protein 750 n=1 Tax=Frankliniella fusca TaxID=407009 RepID=A0AAE1GSP9_9NEOP|nr:Zinc finger protein 750 [Frankliniella fusca]
MLYILDVFVAVVEAADVTVWRVFQVMPYALMPVVLEDNTRLLALAERLRQRREECEAEVHEHQQYLQRQQQLHPDIGFFAGSAGSAQPNRLIVRLVARAMLEVPEAMLLAVVVLVAVLGGARAVLLPPEFAVPTEAACAASLLAGSLSSRSGNLYFFEDDVPWLSAFLRALVPETPRILLGSDFSWARAPGRVYALHRHMFAILMARASAEDLLGRMMKGNNFFNPFTRMLLVTSAPSLRAVIPVVDKLWRCDATVALVVVYPGGAADLLRVSSKTGCGARVEVLDSWSQAAGRWRAGVNPFFAWCLGQYPHHGPPRMLVETDAVNPPSQVRRALEVARLTGVQVVNSTDISGEGLSTLCRADVFFFGVPFMPPTPAEIDGLFATRLSQGVLVVPTGLGARRHLMYALLTEFPPALWALTALAVVSVAAVLSCSPPEAAAALLRALAPLLGQPPPGRPTRHALLACWLLVAVVLGMLYQSMLLDELRRPTSTDLQSVDEFLATDLPASVTFEMYHLRCRRADATECFSVVTSEPSAALADVALHRNAALFVHMEHVPLWLRAAGRAVHLIPVDAAAVRSQYFMRRGSPLGERVRLALARISAAGLMQYWDTWDDDAIREALVDGNATSGAEPRADVLMDRVDVRDVLPALVLLGAGLVLAAVVLTVELVVDRVSSRGRRRPGSSVPLTR